MSAPDDPADGDYKVGYGHPPVHSRFKKGQTGNPLGQPKRPKRVDKNPIGVLTAPIPVMKGGVPCEMTPFEIGVRSMVKNALKENYLRSAREFLRLCEKHKAFIAPPAPENRGIVTVPNDWDFDEFISMYNKSGPPPWPKPRDGLPAGRAAKLERVRRSMNADRERISIFQGERRPKVELDDKRIIHRIAFETHVVPGKGKPESCSTLVLVLRVVRNLAVRGNVSALRAKELYKDKFDPKSGEGPRGVFFRPEEVPYEEYAIELAEAQAKYRGNSTDDEK